jgi:hypothetical protein
MQFLKFRRFTRPGLLRSAGRDLLQDFFAQFTRDLVEAGVPPPPSTASDDEYFVAVSNWLLRPEALPDRLTEALFALDEMASAEGLERLQGAVARAGLRVSLPEDCSNLEVALRIWLQAPHVVATEHNRQRLLRLTRFEYWSGPEGGNSRDPGPPASLDALVERLDAWFKAHLRGEETACVRVFPFGGEQWFLIRHGDTFTRTPKVERRRSEILHFRPERDDVVVWSPEWDEIRINARTRGERELYRQEFGRLLGGNPAHFSDRSTYTLEPLRTEGPRVLDTSFIEGIKRIRLREIEVVADNGHGEFWTRGADDLFAASAETGEPIPSWGRLTRAAFEVEFAGSPRPRPVHVTPPNVLRLGRHCDAPLINHWMRHYGLRSPAHGNLGTRTTNPRRA